MKIKKFKYYVGDFETTVYKGQTHTEVWASGLVELFSEDAIILHSIDDTFDTLKAIAKRDNTNIVVYYHNLRFDGSFWLSYLMTVLHYKQAYEKHNDDGTQGEFLTEKYMPNNSFKYSISSRGQWYSIIIRTGGHFIELRDSLKLLPFSVKRIGEGFKTKHRKLDMEYTGFRYAGCPITKEEEEYLKNDLFVVKEALEFMFNEGHDKLTIGSCCLEEYKRILGEYDYKALMPDMYDFDIDYDTYGYHTAGDWLRKSYKGGWCYLAKGKENKVKTNGTTADVNSLYPSMMSSESGNRYPTGKPTFWKGNYIPEKALMPNRYYFVRIKTRFKLKKGYLPFIQIKDNFLYKPTDMLETSDVYDKENDRFCRWWVCVETGERNDTAVVLTLTMTDYELIKEHYDLIDCEILDGCYFFSAVGIFDEYIEKYKKIKLESKGAMRELAKLFLNNLYGKMASSKDSSFRVAFDKGDGTIGFYTVTANEKQAGYIPIGSAITSYARNFTIRAAQKNYHGVHNRGFIYADTDSIHCDLAPEEIQGITVHDKNFCCWKLESCRVKIASSDRKPTLSTLLMRICNQ